MAAVLGRRVGFGVWDTKLVADISAGDEAFDAVVGTLDDPARLRVEAAIRSATVEGFDEQKSNAYRELLVTATIAAHGRAVLNAARLHLFTAVELVKTAYESRFGPEPGWWFA